MTYFQLKNVRIPTAMPGYFTSTGKSEKQAQNNHFDSG